MALATQCPACGTIFRISTAQAAAKDGMVRCGQCRNVFNSLDALVRVEDLEVIDETLVDPLPEPLAATPLSVAPVEVGPVPADEAIEPLAGHEPPADEAAIVTEWWLPAPGEPRPAAVASPVASSVASAALDGPALEADGQPLSGRRTELPVAVGPLEGTSPSFMRPSPPTTRTGRASRWIFGLLALAATVLLVGQAAYLWRDELAVRWPPARTMLTAACVPLGCTIDYPAHAASITIESANVQVAGPTPNVYVLTALLRNRDPVALRYPNLELVLTDTQDRPILRRALRPEDYLPPRAELGGFAAQSELPIRVTFELSDLRFAGYRLDRFYP